MSSLKNSKRYLYLQKKYLLKLKTYLEKNPDRENIFEDFQEEISLKTQESTKSISQNIFNKLWEKDSTHKKSYAETLLKWYINGSLTNKNLPILCEILEKIKRDKRKFYKIDLRSYKTYQDFIMDMPFSERLNSTNFDFQKSLKTFFEKQEDQNSKKNGTEISILFFDYPNIFINFQKDRVTLEIKESLPRSLPPKTKEEFTLFYNEIPENDRNILFKEIITLKEDFINQKNLFEKRVDTLFRKILKEYFNKKTNILLNISDANTLIQQKIQKQISLYRILEKNTQKISTLFETPIRIYLGIKAKDPANGNKPDWFISIKSYDGIQSYDETKIKNSDLEKIKKFITPHTMTVFEKFTLDFHTVNSKIIDSGYIIDSNPEAITAHEKLNLKKEFLKFES